MAHSNAAARVEIPPYPRAAGAAPSGANPQPWFFALIESAELKARIRAEAEKVERRFSAVNAPATWLAALRLPGTGYPATPVLVPKLERKALAEICRVY